MRNGITMKSNIVEKFDQDYPLAEKEFQRKKCPKLSWAGGLRELRNEYTAIELQKEASVLRVGWTLKPNREREARSEVVN